MVAVIGAGTVGLTLTGALAHLAGTGRCPEPSALLVAARHPHQQQVATELGATSALPTRQLARLVRRRSRSLAVGSPSQGSRQLTGGADLVFDCVGSAESLQEALAIVRPRGRVVLVGMPGRVHLDLASLWHREVSLIGAYAYGSEQVPGAPAPVRTFDLAIEVAGALRTGRLVSATYPLERFEEALAHAGAAGRRGAVKIAFDLRDGTEPPRKEALHEPEARIRARGRPLHPADPLLARRAVPLERLPEGSRVVYPPEPVDALADPDVAPSVTRSTHPLGDSEPLPALLRPGMRLTIASTTSPCPSPRCRRPTSASW